MKFGVFCIALLCTVSIITADTIDENNYKIYDISTKNQFEKEVLLRLSEYEDYDFFLLPRALNTPSRVMVPSENQTDFENLLQRFHLTYKILVENKLENNDEIQPRANKASSSLISFNKFQRANAIDNYLEELAKLYPDRVSVKVIGRSYEGRDMKTIRITNGDGQRNKNVILVDAGIHAREWIGPAAALYIINQLVENFQANSDLLKRYDWVVLPLLNPDGYEYTHTKSRMWRKTRKPVKFLCTGTDANRNFDFHWGEVGASSTCSSDTYKGSSAFSEPETQNLRSLMHDLSGEAKFYLTLHSYGNYLLYPWGYKSQLPDNVDILDKVAQAGAKAIRSATGTKYTVGSSTNVLYAAAGGSDDYALGVVGIPVSITMELPAGGSGFNPSTSQILPFVKETWIGIRAMAEKVMEIY